VDIFFLNVEKLLFVTIEHIKDEYQIQLFLGYHTLQKIEVG